ncbi:MAG: four helix bundle protein [Chloroflexi bacterium]|nr:four helix bundle protein [Chloroflexota bacterium]
MTFKFERFETWKLAIGFADRVLILAEGFPQRYQFSLGEQLRRAALSVPTNLAEGSGRDNPRERAYLYVVAKGSLYEVISLLVVAGRRELISRDTYRALYHEADELAAMISGAIKTTRNQG